MSSVRVVRLLAVMAALVMIVPASLVLASDEYEADDPDPYAGNYYYDRLSGDAIALDMYRSMMGAFGGGNGTFTTVTVDSVQKYMAQVTLSTYYGSDDLGLSSGKAFDALVKDNPLDFYWAGNQCRYSDATPSTFSIIVSDDFTAELNSKTVKTLSHYSTIESFIDSYSMTASSDYSKLKVIHSWTVARLTYDTNFDSPSGKQYIRSVYGATVLQDGKYYAVCEGYAKLFKVFCDDIGLECILISGTGVTSSGSEGHMWCAVHLEDETGTLKWYLVDPTWDDQSTIRYEYFLAGSGSMGFNGKTIAQDHLPEASAPTLSAISYQITPGNEGDTKDFQWATAGTATKTEILDFANNVVGDAGKGAFVIGGVKIAFTYKELLDLANDVGDAGTVVFAAEKIDTQYTLKDKIDLHRPVYDITVTVNGTERHDFSSGTGDGKVYISIPYEKKIGDIDMLIGAWYVNGETAQKMEGAAYADGYVTFETTHLSGYIVGSNQYIDFPILLLILIPLVLLILVIVIIVKIVRGHKAKKEAKRRQKSLRKEYREAPPQTHGKKSNDGKKGKKGKKGKGGKR